MYTAVVPDLHIVGSLQAIHVMLDKPQLELIKGLVEMNLGETINEFEKPSSVIRDPIAQVSIPLSGFGKMEIQLISLHFEHLWTISGKRKFFFAAKSISHFNVSLWHAQIINFLSTPHGCSN